MAINFPGPYELRLFYVTGEPAAIRDHVLRLSMDMATPAGPGDPFSSWFPLEKGGSSSESLEDTLDELLVLLRPLWPSTTDFSHAELWEYDPGTFDAIFRTAHTISLSGTSGGAGVDYAQAIITFRSQNGGIAKIDMRGLAIGPAVFQGFPTSSTPINNLAGYMVSNDSPFIARDQGFLLAPIKFLPGQNEHSWKVVNR